jgi:hypothetical protein
MTTITETQGVLPDLIDSIASEATALAEWSDADTGVTNDQSSTNYVDNGRVLEHGPSGMYLGFFLQSNKTSDNSDYNNYGYGGGIRVVHSTGWDTDTNSPTGNTDVRSGDPWSGDTGNMASDSLTTYDVRTDYDSQYYGDANSSTSLWVLEENTNIDNLQTVDVTYFGSVTSEWINVAAWNTQDGTNGSAGYYTFEYPNSKFWPDGNTPYFAYAFSNVDNGIETALNSFNVFYGRRSLMTADRPFDAPGFGTPKWGIVNPASDDDTFFFRRGVHYQSASSSVPVSYITSTIANDQNEGGSHGDTIDHEGETYRVFKQSGAGNSMTLSVGVRYE